LTAIIRFLGSDSQQGDDADQLFPCSMDCAEQSAYRVKFGPFALGTQIDISESAIVDR